MLSSGHHDINHDMKKFIDNLDQFLDITIKKYKTKQKERVMPKIFWKGN